MGQITETVCEHVSSEPSERLPTCGWVSQQHVHCTEVCEVRHEYAGLIVWLKRLPQLV